MIISFDWTTPALLAGAKTVTRRDWNPKHAARFKAGMLVDAWNTLPRNAVDASKQADFYKGLADELREHLRWLELSAEAGSPLASLVARYDTAKAGRQAGE